MEDDRFEWSDAKARANVIDHKVSFEVASLVLDDPRGLDEGKLLTVTYTDRSGRIRIVSGRKATRHEQDDYFSQAF